MATGSFIETLLQLDGSSARFSEQLSGVLARSESDEIIYKVRATDQMQVVEVLDKVLPFRYPW